MRQFVMTVCVAWVSCSPPPTVECRVGADCASGVCKKDGTCERPASDGGSGGSGGAGGGSSMGVDAGSDGGSADSGVSDSGVVDSGMPSVCQPNNDGTISRAEVFTQAGLRANFKVSGTATFDTAGSAMADGGRLWDFTQMLAGDQSRQVETRPLTGLWFENDYPDAGYVTALGNLLAVFESNNDALLLRGIVSEDSGVLSTKIRYDPPVKVLSFPLTPGKTWSTNTTVSGTYQGGIIGLTLPFQTEEYTSVIDRSGDALTPYARFPVLRVRTNFVRRLNTVSFLTLTTHQFVTECFGSIATINSADNQTANDFTSAAEVRRLAP